MIRITNPAGVSRKNSGNASVATPLTYVKVTIAMRVMTALPASVLVHCERTAYKMVNTSAAISPPTNVTRRIRSAVLTWVSSLSAASLLANRQRIRFSLEDLEASDSLPLQTDHETARDANRLRKSVELPALRLTRYRAEYHRSQAFP
jgi:hydroxypyruvate isomerase